MIKNKDVNFQDFTTFIFSLMNEDTSMYLKKEVNIFLLYENSCDHFKGERGKEKNIKASITCRHVVSSVESKWSSF